MPDTTHEELAFDAIQDGHEHAAELQEALTTLTTPGVYYSELADAYTAIETLLGM